MVRHGLWLLIAGFAAFFAAAPAGADALDQARQAGAFTIGYRGDAPPFAYLGPDGKPAGYSVDLCERIAAAVKQALGEPPIAIKHERITAQNRFDALEAGRIDILCEGTTVTLGRRERMDFTLMTFLSGGALMVRAASPIRASSQLDGRKVGVLKGTTTEAGLRRSLQQRALNATVIAVDTHDQGVAILQAGEIDAYFADRELLLGLAHQARGGPALLIGEDYLSYEPYALAIRKGEHRLRLLADRTIAGVYRSGEIGEIFTKWLGAAQPSDPLRAMYLIQAVPE